MTSIGERVRILAGKIDSIVDESISNCKTLSVWTGTPYKTARIIVGMGDDANYYGITCETIYTGNRVVVHPGNWGPQIKYAATRATPWYNPTPATTFTCINFCSGTVYFADIPHYVSGSTSECVTQVPDLWRTCRHGLGHPFDAYCSTAPTWYRSGTNPCTFKYDDVAYYCYTETLSSFIYAFPVSQHIKYVKITASDSNNAIANSPFMIMCFDDGTSAFFNFALGGPYTDHEFNYPVSSADQAKHCTRIFISIRCYAPMPASKQHEIKSICYEVV